MTKSQPWDYYPLLPIFAFKSEKKARKFVKEKTGTDFTVTGKNGQCTWYESEKGGGFVVILLRCKGKSASQKLAVLAHECVHYAQYFEEAQGEKLDTESEAYIVQSAFHACIDQLGDYLSD